MPVPLHPCLIFFDNPSFMLALEAVSDLSLDCSDFYFAGFHIIAFYSFVDLLTAISLFQGEDAIPYELVYLPDLNDML